jgi:hypothetical protein
MSDFRKLRDTAKRENDERYRTNSKKRLLTNINKKFQTTMIGALAAFEKRFGHIWDQDTRWLEVWNQARTEILDIGNKNLRAAEQEISEYTISWDRYEAEFLPMITYKEKR